MQKSEPEFRKLRGILIFDQETWDREGFPGAEKEFTDGHFKKFLGLAKLEKYQEIFAKNDIKTKDFLEIFYNLNKFESIIKDQKELFKLGAYAFQLRFLLKPPTTLLKEYPKGENEKELKKNKTICEITSASKEKDENMTKLIDKKKECKTTIDTNQIIKKDPTELTLYLKQNNNNKLKSSNNVIIGRLKPEESKYKDFDFFQIDTKECSRMHAIIYKTRVGYFLSDNNTPNGTYLRVPTKGITFKDTDNLIFEIGTYLYTFQFKMREGKSIIKVCTYLYLHELYEGKTKRKNKFIMEWKSYSSIKCGSNPGLPLDRSSEDCYPFQNKDKKMSNDHFWLKKTKDQDKYMLIPFDSQTEVWVAVKENNKNEIVGIKKGDIIRVANVLIKVKKSPPFELPKGHCKCSKGIPFDGYVEDCEHFYCSECLKKKKKCYPCNKKPITSYKKIYEYLY